MTARAIEVLRRHYAATGNPLFVWKAIRLLSKRPWAPLPPWVSEYLWQAACTLIDLGEGIDRSRMPPLPQKGVTDSGVAEYFQGIREFEAEVTVDDAKAPRLAMRTLGFISRRNRNVFREYRQALQEQGDAETAAIRRAEHLAERLLAGKKETQASFIASEAEAAGRETRTIEKRLEKAEKSLARGKLEVDPFGPEAARRRKLRT